MDKRKIALIIHNVRSTHNVGSMFRSVEGLGIDEVFLSGYTPYPKMEKDERLPHISSKITKQIHKTALGAEKSVRWTRVSDIKLLIKALRQKSYSVAALEQTEEAEILESLKSTQNIALIVGNEVDGIDESTLDLADFHLQIPMAGQKESFNVAVAAAIAMYYLKFHTQKREPD